MKRNTIPFFAFIILAAGIMLSGCSGLVPNPQPYPYEDASTIKAKAQDISNNLEAYIRDWLAGRVPALIPETALPPGIYIDPLDPNKKSNPDLRLIAWDAARPEDYTVVRKAETVDQNALMSLFPDPHYTYLLNCKYISPFGSKAVIKGKFPHSRFFLITPTMPINGRQYNFYAFGPAENPIIDVDIIPDSGSINPFRVGANRNATNRSYQVTIENRIDDVAAAPDIYCPKPPYYRAAGNVRYGSGILYQGPGIYGPPDGKNPLWRAGELWIRYGLPDNWGKAGFDPLAGVGLPKTYYQLATGEKYMIIYDMNVANTNYLSKYPAQTVNADPGTAEFEAPGDGWKKMFGILHAVSTQTFIGYGFTSAADKTKCHDIIRGVEGRGGDMPAPGNWEGSATCVNHCNYFTHETKVADGKCMVVTGKLPKFPSTQNGEATMTNGEMRYWSLCMNEDDAAGRGMGICTGTVADFQLKLDANRRYIICFSKAAYKPTNATAANGVTWIDWGPNSKTHHTMRWISVNPDWSFSKSPHEGNLTWQKLGWEMPTYDPNIIGKNTRTGWLGEYQPVFKYMDAVCFSQLGSPVTWEKIDAITWDQDCCGTSLVGTARAGGLLVFLPLLFGMMCCGIWRLRKM